MREFFDGIQDVSSTKIKDIEGRVEDYAKDSDRESFGAAKPAQQPATKTNKNVFFVLDPIWLTPYGESNRSSQK